MKRLRLDDLLVERGLFPDRASAAPWIMARKVRVGDAYETKPGTPVAVDAAIAVPGLERRYVSRGGDKLAAALERFDVDAAGAVVLDAGASTGGFTDCLLQHGAALVYSVDAGFGQLRGSLATHPRVRSLERTNIGDLSRDGLDPPLDLAVADLSYLSVRRSLPILTALFRRSPRVVHLIKPLFEGLSDAQVRDDGALRTMLTALGTCAEDCGLRLRDAMASPIAGSGGTLEFFASFGPESPAPAAAELAAAAVEEAFQGEPAPASS